MKTGPSVLILSAGWVHPAWIKLSMNWSAAGSPICETGARSPQVLGWQAVTMPFEVGT
jgi:hypothetical protein